MTHAPPKVFISYSHDTVEHQERVLGLADRLRADGIDAEVDQYNGAPPEGWPLWCERQIEAADIVLMVCTETYHRRVSGDEEHSKGLGVVWEARIIRQLLYDAGAVSEKFVPVLFSDASPEQIPTPIKGGTRYVVDTEDGYEDLYRRLSGQSCVTRPVLGVMRPLPARESKWLQRGTATRESGITRWRLRLDANVEEIDPILLRRLTDILREVSGDATLSIKLAFSGSIILELECSSKAGLRLHSLIDEGALRELFGYRVLGITPVGEALRPALEAIRAALAAFVAGGASEKERRLVGDALRAGRLVLAEGERSVALGGSADGATIVTGDGNVVVALDASAARELRALMGPPVPRQLPSDLADLTGRELEIEALERALGGEGGGAAITAIGGMGGVGKTALAVHVARRLAARYPDGQIVVNLKGTTEPLSPATAMGRVIVALDPVRKLPDDEGELAGLYRSLLGGKRLLILFDNAAGTAQVRELLPAPPGAAIVTSRRAEVLAVVLPGQRVPLDVLAPKEADALLLQIIGERRASAEERATLAERCGRLPLALRVAGTFLVSYPNWGVAEYLAALADERERLRRLRIEGDALLNVAAVLGLSLRQLAYHRPELVVRWRMLAVFAGGFDREAAAAVWAVASVEARDGLSPLVERSMLMFDAAKQRYRLHDLMRDLAFGGAEPLSEEEQCRLEETRDRHAAHFQRLLAEANGLFVQGGGSIVAGLDRFDQERANIEAGWRWLLDQVADDEAVARRRSDFVAAGYRLLPLRQHPRRRIEWLEVALPQRGICTTAGVRALPSAIWVSPTTASVIIAAPSITTSKPC